MTINRHAYHISDFCFLIVAPPTTIPTTTVISTSVAYEVRYSKTADYHWPNFYERATNRQEKKFQVVQGPFGFGSAVQLKKDRKEVVAIKDMLIESYSMVHATASRGGLIIRNGVFGN